MERVKFVVLDFVIQPHPDGFAAAKGRKVDKRQLAWEELTDKVMKKVRSMLVTAALSEGEKIHTRCEVEGADDDKGHTHLASFLIHNPNRQHVLGIEDFLRGHVPTEEGEDIPDDAQPHITVKVKDHKGRYLNFQVTDFTLSGPTTGNWKPFTEWYGAIKQMGLLSEPVKQHAQE